ncbi:MAG: hypothetical protein ACLVC6_11585 [Alistipes ihumii]|uniref:hypothetical protein n=1 Tax=Alistipes ihumii TaxID=1470347 RepID=UPI00399A3682
MLYAFVLLVGLAVGALVVAGLVHRPAARRWAETERGLRAEAETRNAELNALTRDAAGSSAQRQALEKELAELKAERERERGPPRRGDRRTRTTTTAGVQESGQRNTRRKEPAVQAEQPRIARIAAESFPRADRGFPQACRRGV